VQPDLKPVSRYRFGPIDVDPTAGEIHKFGAKVRVPKKPFLILLALLEHPGDVVTRETLREQLWSSDTFVEFEHALNAAINRLRSALGDDASNPRYIETVPGRGYRLIMPVENAAARPEVVEMPQVSSPPARSHWPWILAAALGVLAVFAGGMWIGHRAGGTLVIGPTVRFTIPPPPGAVFEPATARQPFQISPDGRYLAFTARSSVIQRSVWLRDFAQAESRPLPDTKDAYSLFWSPDSAYIYYTVFTAGSLRRISLTGGPQDALAQMPPRLLSAWFHQGEIRSADRESGWALPVNGGAIRKLPIPQPWAQPLPDSDRIIYTDWDDAKNINQVRLAAPDQPGKTLFESDSRVFLTPSTRDPERSWLLYMRNGNLVARGFDHKAGRLTSDGPIAVAAKVPYFRATGTVEASVAGGTLAWLDHPDRSQLVWVDRQGRELSQVGPVLSSFNKVRLSADGRWAVMPVIDRNRGALDVWTVEVATGAARRVSTWAASADSPVFSPDAGRIVCAKASGRSPVLAMLTLREGDAPERFPEGFPEASIQLPSDWSPDGRFISETNIWFTHPAGQQNSNTYLVDLARKSEVVPLLAGSQSMVTSAVFAPDGRSIAFLANDSGHREAYVQPFDPEIRRLTGIRHQISRGGAQLVRWPKPGRELFYLSADNWICAATLTGEPKRLFEVSPQAISMLHPPFTFDVAAGGERFLLPAYRGDRPPSLAIVLNWENLVSSSSSTGTAHDPVAR
jgi:DNA-binding winged helix-turn-helix (wHTH) protein/Tol biopolymer transport system component